jgi:adenylate cyclase
VTGYYPAEPRPSRHIAWANRAVLLVDIAESVRLIEQDESGVISRWIDFVEQVRTDVLPRHGGRLVKSLGDGMLLDFGEVRSAVAAALEIQHISALGNIGLAQDERILLRMGMELTDVIMLHDDVLGRGVNLAARLMTLASPGEIVVSQQVRDRLTPDLDADVEDMGDCFLRHLSHPVRAYRLTVPGSHPAHTLVTSFEELAPSLAVVPFVPLDAADPWCAIGEVLAEELIRTLSRSSDINLISRLSTSTLRGRGLTLQEIGVHLHAEYVLSGVYHSDEHHVRLDVELAETKSGRILWSEHLKDDMHALLSEDQELISRLVSGVSSAVMMRELQKARAQPVPTLKAYTLLISAITLIHHLSQPNFQEARRLLEALIERRARQPIPLAWLANWHVLRVQQGWSPDEQQDAYLALECTKRALDADPECSLALAINGFVHTNLLKRFDIAQQSYEDALTANPSNALAWLLKGTMHAFMSEGKQAIEHTERALKLSPLDPHRYFYDSLSATACVAAHQYERAVELAQRSLRANRKHTSTLRVLTIAQWQLGRCEEARRTVEDLLKLEPALTVSGWLSRSPAAPYPIGQEAAEALRQAGVPD